MSVSLSPLAYLSVFKSAAESHPDSSLGVVVGFDDAGVYHVTGAFALPPAQTEAEAEEAAVLGDEAFVEAMVQSLDRMTFEGFPVGVYAAGNVGAFPSAAAFALAEKLKVKLILLADLPVFKALRSAPRAFLAEADVKEVELAVTSSGAAAHLLKANASWLELHVKPKNVRVQNFLERCLDNVARLAPTAETSAVEKRRAARAAQALYQETHRAAKALLL